MSAQKFLYHANLAPKTATTPVTRLLMAFLVLVATTIAALAQTNIQEFQIVKDPIQSTVPLGITYGPDGAYWFCEFAGNSIGRIDPVTTNMTAIGLTNNGAQGLLGSNASPSFIVVGPDNNLWFTEANSNKIARLNAATSNYIEIPVSTNKVLATNTYPFFITVGPDNNLWFVEYNQNKIAAFNPSDPTNASGILKFVHEYGPFGSSTRFGSPGTNAQIYTLTTGPDGNLWFTQSSYGTIVRMDTNGNYSMFQLSASNSQPLSIVTGADQAMWFGEFNTNRIGRIKTDLTTLTEFIIPTNVFFPLASPYALLLGHDGNIWFSQFAGSDIGSITTNGVITLFPTPTQNSQPTFLATGTPAFGSDTNIWFGEFNSQAISFGIADDNIGMIVVGEALSLTATSPQAAAAKTFSGQLATFENSNTNNTVLIGWGDGTTNSLFITNTFATTNSIVISNAVRFTNSVTITETTPVITNGFNNQFAISAIHTFISPSNNFNVTLTVSDGSNDVATANIFITDGAVVRVPLTLKTSGTNLILSWPGPGFKLQSAPSSHGPWNTINGAVSPFTTPSSGTQKFFRLEFP